MSSILHDLSGSAQSLAKPGSGLSGVENYQSNQPGPVYTNCHDGNVSNHVH